MKDGFTEKRAQIVRGAQVHRTAKEFAERILNFRHGDQSGHMSRFEFGKEIDVAFGLHGVMKRGTEKRKPADTEFLAQRPDFPFRYPKLSFKNHVSPLLGYGVQFLSDLRYGWTIGKTAQR